VAPLRRDIRMLQYVRNVMQRQHGDDGASAVEYGLLVAAIAAFIILLVFALGGYVKGAFKETCDAFSGAPVTSVAVTGASCAS